MRNISYIILQQGCQNGPTHQQVTQKNGWTIAHVALIMGNEFFSPSAEHTIVSSEVRQVIVMYKDITY